jgi:hypothetical protein
MTPGRIFYHVAYQPAEWLARSWREGGPVNQWITRRGRLAMTRAARRLPPLAEPLLNAPEVCFLTGRRFWFQTAFCFWSLCRQAGRPLRATFYDDGTVDAVIAAEVARLFPGARIETAARIERYPTLRAHRKEFILLRKLTDVHAGHIGWRLFLDSDMLFFRPPAQLLDWLAAPAAPLHMLDVRNAYGYSDEILSSLCERPIPALVNTGVLGLPSHELDWDRLEHWTRALLERHGSSYYLEQALVALSIAGRPAVRLPKLDFLLMPSETEARHPTAVMHHYVDLSKRGYFRHAWREAAPLATSQ